MAGRTLRQNNIVLTLVGTVLILVSSLVGVFCWWPVLWWLDRKISSGYWYGLFLALIWAGVTGIDWGLSGIVVGLVMVVSKWVEDKVGDNDHWRLGGVVLSGWGVAMLFGQVFGFKDVVGMLVIFWLLTRLLVTTSHDLRLKEW